MSQQNKASIDKNIAAAFSSMLALRIRMARFSVPGVCRRREIGRGVKLIDWGFAPAIPLAFGAVFSAFGLGLMYSGAASRSTILEVVLLFAVAVLPVGTLRSLLNRRVLIFDNENKSIQLILVNNFRSQKFKEEASTPIVVYIARATAWRDYKMSTTPRQGQLAFLLVRGVVFPLAWHAQLQRSAESAQTALRGIPHTVETDVAVVQGLGAWII